MKRYQRHFRRFAQINTYSQLQTHSNALTRLCNDSICTTVQTRDIGPLRTKHISSRLELHGIPVLLHRPGGEPRGGFSFSCVGN